jgi:hypothetical protein
MCVEPSGARIVTRVRYSTPCACVQATCSERRLPAICNGLEKKPLELAAASHELELVPGTRLLKRAHLRLHDSGCGLWQQTFEVVSPPWFPQTLGYHPGGWKDGGIFSPITGRRNSRWSGDELDLSVQPFSYTPYRVTGQAAHSPFGEGATVGVSGRPTLSANDELPRTGAELRFLRRYRNLAKLVLVQQPRTSSHGICRIDGRAAAVVRAGRAFLGANS